MRYGVVYFDAALDKRRKKSNDGTYVQARDGWASVGGADAFRIEKLADLPSDVVWITNLDFDSYRSNRLTQIPNYVPSYYLKSDIAQIAAEIGAHQDHERITAIVQALAQVFARTMRLAETYFGVTEIPSDQIKKLENAIATATGRRKQVVDAPLNDSMKQAYQNRCLVIGQPIPREWWQCTLRRNRYQHAYDVLDTPVPSPNNWEYLDASKLPIGAKDRIDWVINNPKPVLAKARVSDGKGMEASITSFGAKKRSDVTREWLCAPELYWVSRYYNTVEIDAVYVCHDGYVLLPELERFPAPNEFTLASISMGLITENFLAVMTEPFKNPVGVEVYYPHCIWYAAMDRFILFTHAYQIVRASSYGNANSGFRVHSYGFGNIQVATPHEKVDELTDIAGSLGLEVPSSAYWKRTMQSRQSQTAWGAQ
jgi:hypothetical protein